MNNVWNKLLGPNEKVEYEFSIGKRYRILWLVVWCIIALPFVFGGMLKSGLFIIAIAAFYTLFYQTASNAYAFTNRRVLIHRGWLSTSSMSIDYDKITDIRVEQSFVDKLISKTGTLSINTAGSIGVEVVLKNITDPYEVKKRLDSIRHH